MIIPPYAPTLEGRDVAGWLDFAIEAAKRGDLVESRRCSDVAVRLARAEVAVRAGMFGQVDMIDSVEVVS